MSGEAKSLTTVSVVKYGLDCLRQLDARGNGGRGLFNASSPFRYRRFGDPGRGGFAWTPRAASAATWSCLGNTANLPFAPLRISSLFVGVF